LIRAVVSRGGRPDLAQTFLPEVKSPTLLIVGELDEEVLALNRQALSMLHSEKALTTVKGASHLFEEEGTLGQAGILARDWFLDHFKSALS
jgi:putative phosphoribosyl transferase